VRKEQRICIPFFLPFDGAHPTDGSNIFIFGKQVRDEAVCGQEKIFRGDIVVEVPANGQLIEQVVGQRVVRVCDAVMMGKGRKEVMGNKVLVYRAVMNELTVFPRQHSREQGGGAWRGKVPPGIMIVVDDRSFGQPSQIGRGLSLVSIEGNIVGRKSIQHDHDDVWRGLRV